MENLQPNAETARNVPRDETPSLIASDKVEGTAVYGADRKKIGSVENVMIDKLSGQVAYAVLSFGGFLGMGTDYYPVPWSTLTYDSDLGGYRANITEDQLKSAPAGKAGPIAIWRVNGRMIRDHVFIDFTEGGNSRVYKWMPANEIWLDHDVDPGEVKFVKLHELHEYNRMADGLSYERAHESA